MRAWIGMEVGGRREGSRAATALRASFYV